jgi:hypothetical protein
MAFLTLSHHAIRNVKRPSLMWNGHSENHQSFWSAIEFECDLDPFEICKKFETVTLSASVCEHWKFYHAHISLLDSKFVMIFDRCERLTTPK